MARSVRRKEQRPEQIMQAALEEFAAKGYAETRLDDVASRAGISKGLVYVYFRTKEELFKAVIRTFLVPRVESVRAQAAASELSSEALIRGPVLGLMKQVLGSRMHTLVRLLIAEGPKHPDLTAFYYEQVVSRGIGLLQDIVDRGVARGEFRPTPLRDFPQLIIAPMIMAVIWKLLMERHHPLDAERLLEAHVGLLLHALRAGDVSSTGGAAGEERA
ncbi:MAG: TetR/AcrR family transcriptional regulator [Hyphomicrobiaceae bacterium]|nr:TetR/AcrR family transcriptional regulator [Hyphomicrobiaceae bacterium]